MRQEHGESCISLWCSSRYLPLRSNKFLPNFYSRRIILGNFVCFVSTIENFYWNSYRISSQKLPYLNLLRINSVMFSSLMVLLYLKQALRYKIWERLRNSRLPVLRWAATFGLNSKNEGSTQSRCRQESGTFQHRQPLVFSQEYGQYK